MNKKSHFIKILKFIIGAFLLILLLIWQDNGRKVIEVFLNFRWQYIIALFSIAIFLNWISCIKWKLFLKERGITISIFQLFMLYLIGQFFNNFMLGIVAGDLTRIYLLGRKINSHSKSAASVILERLTGFMALMILALAFSLINFRLLKEPIIRISIIIITFCFLIFFIIVFNPKIIDIISNKFQFLPFSIKVFSKIKKVIFDINYFKGKHRLLLFAMLYSFAFHLFTSVNVYFSCLAIHFHPSFLDVAVITPIILLITSIPVSPGNIGWWEWSFSVLLAQAGAGIPQGVAVALIIRAVGLVFSALGGLFFLFEKFDVSKSKVLS